MEDQFNSTGKFAPFSSKAPRSSTFLLVLTILLFLTGTFGVWFFSNPALVGGDNDYDDSIYQFNPPNHSQPVVGGDKDEHGCIGSAGYSWCQVKNKCLRIWEEQCGGTDQFCGGIAAIKCPTGYSCKLDGAYPDAGGKCQISPAQKSPDTMCAQVVTRARNDETGETHDFPTPCDVPSGWSKVNQ